jgi:large subunit ribosomal protein L22
MPVTAKLNYLRIAPRKVRLVADLVRGKSVKEVQSILNFTVKKSATPLLKLLNQAVASAINNFQLNPDNLYISKITVDEGPKYKRWRPRARGQTYEIQKKTSHITIILDEKVKTKNKVKKIKRPKETMFEEAKEKITKLKTPKPKPKIEITKPKIEKGVIKRIFRRKSF